MNKIIAKKITKQYGKHIILNNFNLEVKENEFVIITGKSGSGKSTLCNILGLLDPTYTGKLIINGIDVKKLSLKNRQRFIKDNINYLFQNYALLDNKSIKYNLELVFQSKKERKKQIDQIINVLDKVGLKDCLKQKVYECSGGQQQRIAFARTLLKPGQIIICDEPTGSLDQENKDLIMNLLKQEQQKQKTIIVVSHDQSIFHYANRIIQLK